MKRNLKILIGLLTESTFANKVLRFIQRKKLIILYYHRVLHKDELAYLKNANMGIDVESFEKQIKFLSENYNVISEREIISAINGIEELPDAAIWVTFDDGYEDNYTNAMPVLKKYNIPATFFVTTGFINKQLIPCEDYIAEAVKRTNLDSVDFILNNKRYKISLDSSEAKTYAIRELWRLMDENENNIDEYLKTLQSALKLGTEDIDGLFMDWNQIKQLSISGFCIGAHTIGHEILSRIPKEEIDRSILESKKEIEGRIGIKVDSFAYPRGKKEDNNLRVCLPILEKNGFSLAVTTLGGTNKLALNKRAFYLKRIGVSFKGDFNFFKFKVASGAFWQT